MRVNYFHDLWIRGGPNTVASVNRRKKCINLKSMSHLSRTNIELMNHDNGGAAICAYMITI